MGMGKDNLLTVELRRFNQRKLVKGELVLLAKAISDRLPLPGSKVPVDMTYLLNYMRGVERVTYRLTEFAHLSTDDLDQVKDFTLRFLRWRSAVATGTALVMFSGEPDTVIDDMSSLLRYFDSCVLCSIADITTSKDWVLATFRKLVEEEYQDAVTSEAN